MKYFVQPGTQVRFSMIMAPPGLQPAFRLLNLATGQDGIPASDAGITEPSPGIYTVVREMPAIEGDWQPIWNDGLQEIPDEDTYQTSVTAPLAVPPAVIPTADQVRARSRAEFAEYGYPAGDPDPLDPLIAEAVAELTGAMLTRGITVDFTLVSPASVTGQLIHKVLRMWTEYLAASNQPELIDMSADYEVLSSAGTGPAVESRRGVGADHSALHPWPPLDRLLGFVVQLWNEQIDPSDLPPDVPAVDQGSPLPKPGAWIMDRKAIGHPLDASIFGAPPTLGVAPYLEGG